MAPSVVQSAQYSSGTSTSSTGTIVYTTAPTVGDLLMVGMSYAGPKHPATAPAGWTQLDDLEVSTNAWLTVFYHIVGASEANSYTFSTNGGDFLSIMALDITGQAGSGYINQHAANALTNAASITTTAVTPSVVGCLAATFYATNDGTDIAVSTSTLSAGWTVDQDVQPTYHAGAVGHQTALTADTTTPVSATWSFDSSGTNTTNSVAQITLIAPAASAASFIAPKPFIVRQAVKRAAYF